VQLPEADLLPTTFAVLPAPQQLQLPRVSASKLQLPQAQETRVATEYYAILGSTMLQRAYPLASQPALQLPQRREIQLPPSSGVKLPRLERLAECKQAGAALAGAAAAAHAAVAPPP
jgi:hypothetical protein